MAERANGADTTRATDAAHARRRRRRGTVPARLPWPVLQRPEELRAVAVVADHAWSVAIVGAPGLGKSVIAGRVSDRVAARDTSGRTLVVPITAVPHDSTMPFSAVSSRFGELPAEVLVDDLDAEQRLREAADVADRSLVLRIEGADHLDAISARYVAWLVRNQGVRLVLTCRDFAALAEPLRSLWQDDLMERIDLAPLDLRSTARLLERALDAPLESASVERVHRATQGNPLYLREVVRAALASGDLEHTASGWYWRGRITASNSLADMYRTELAALPEDLRDVVEIVALADPIPLSNLLSLVADSDVDRVVALGLVRIGHDTTADGTPVVRPSHPLVGEVVRALVPVARRTRLFARANAFRTDQVHGAPPAARLRATLWALECGVVPPALQLLDAAQVAVRLQEYDSAIALVGAALGRTGSDEGVSAVPPGERTSSDVRDDQRSAQGLPPTERVAALCLRSVAHTFSVGREGGRPDAERAWSIVRSDAAAIDDRLVIEACETLANIRQFHDDDVDAAVALVDEAVGYVGDEARERLRVLRLAHLGWGGRFAEVRRFVEETGIVHAPTVPTAFLAVAPCAVMALATAGRLDDAMALGRASLETAIAHIEDSPWSVGELVSVMHQTQVWIGDIGGLITQVSERRTSPFFKYDFTLELLGSGNLAIAQRRWDDAIDAFSAACERFETLDHGGFAAYPWARLALAQAYAGRPEEAAASLERAAATPVRGMRVAGEQVAVTIAWTETVLGRPDGLDHAEEIAARATADGSFVAVMYMRALQFSTDLMTGRDTTASGMRLREVAVRVDGALAAAMVAYVDGLAADDRARIAEAQAAMSAAGMAVTAGRPRPPLTTREFEVAGLAAKGLSNRRIAEELGLSVRTIDAHMSRVFTKWDLHARTELADLV